MEWRRVEASRLKTQPDLSLRTARDACLNRIRIFFRMGCLALVWACPCEGREGLEQLLRPAYRVYTHKDGLPQDTVHAIAMEPTTNRLWVATQDGLAHFNGRQWQSESLPNRQVSNYVRALAFDSLGTLWAGTNGDGLFRFQDQRWESFLRPGGFLSKRVNTLLADPHEGSTWIGTHGQGLWSHREGLFSRVKLPGDPGSGIVWALLDGRWQGQSRLWLGMEGALLYREAGRWQRLQLPPELAQVSINSLWVEPNETSLWLGTWGKGIWRWEKGEWQHFGLGQGLPDEQVTSLTATTGRDAHHWTLWAGTFNGLARWGGRSWQTVGRKGEAFHRPTYSLLATKWNVGAESLWVGTRGGGLARMDLGRWQSLDTSSGLPSEEIRAIIATQGPGQSSVVWIGAERGGLVEVQDSGLQLHPLPGGAQGIHSLLHTQDSGDSTIWVGTRTGETMRWRANGWERLPKPGASNTDVLALAQVEWEPGRFRVFAGTNRGLFWFGQGAWHPVAQPELQNTYIQCLHVSPSDRSCLWIGTRNLGLARLDAHELRFYSTTQGLPNPWVRDVAFRQGPTSREVWIATAGGLAILEEGTDRISSRGDLQVLDENQTLTGSGRNPGDLALPSLVINQVEFDNQGRSYLMTTRGLIRLEPRPGGVWAQDAYTEEDGLPEGEGVPGAARLDGQGRMWLGTTAGLAVLDLAQELRDQSSKPLVLESVKAEGKVLVPTQSRTFPHRFRDWSFEAAPMGFTRSDRAQYRFQLEGYEATPSPWSHESRRSYTNLLPGSYRLRVWALDGWGNPSPSITWDFQIKPAPWATWWAWCLEGMAIAGTILLVFRWRMGLLKVHTQELRLAVETRTHELAEARDAALAASRHKTDFLAVMSHEVRTPLNGILGMSDLLTATPLDPVQREYVEAIRISNHHLSALINDVLDLSKIEADRLDLDVVPFDLVRELEEVAAPLASVARAKGLEFICDLPGMVPSLVKGDPTRLRQVVLNLLSNAVKFTNQGSVILRGEILRPSPLLLRLEVQDSGRGIPQEFKDRLFEPFRQADASTSREFGGTGLGLAISRRLVEKMGGTIACRSQAGDGTTFTLELEFEVISPALPPSAGGGPVVLLMRPSLGRLALIRNLQDWHMEVRTADTQQALLTLVGEGGLAHLPGFLIDSRDLDMDPSVFSGLISGVGPIGILATMDALAGLASGAAAGHFQVLTNPWRQAALRAFLSGAALELPSPSPSEARLRGKVLVVDDHPINRKVMHAMLENLGLASHEVASGQEALDRLSAEAFDLLLMDCEMPGMDGFEATQKLRLHSTVPVVALTAHVLEGTREKCLAAGMDDYLSKPVKVEALMAALHRWLPNPPPPASRT